MRNHAIMLLIYFHIFHIISNAETPAVNQKALVACSVKVVSNKVIAKFYNISPDPIALQMDSGFDIQIEARAPGYSMDGVSSDANTLTKHSFSLTTCLLEGSDGRVFTADSTYTQEFLLPSFTRPPRKDASRIITVSYCAVALSTLTKCENIAEMRARFMASRSFKKYEFRIQNIREGEENKGRIIQHGRKANSK